MKPQLIKFSCPVCQTRLAVPVAMAGMEDHCPKCGNVVSAPHPEPVPASALPPELLAPPPAPERAAIVAPIRSVLETVAKAHATPVVTPQPASLFDDFLSAPIETPAKPPQEPQPPAPEPPAPEPPAPEPPAPTPHIAPPAEPVALIASEPDPEPESEEVPPPFLQETELPEPVRILPEPEPLADLPPAAETEDSSDAPDTVPFLDHPPAEPAEQPAAHLGLGQMMDHASSSQTLPVTRHVVPSLGVGLIKVGDYSRNARVRRRRWIAVVGITTFLVVDAVVVVWIFRHRIQEWWQARSARPQVTATVSTPPTKSGDKDPREVSEARPYGDLRNARTKPKENPPGKTAETATAPPKEDSPPAAAVEPEVPKPPTASLSSLLTSPGPAEPVVVPTPLLPTPTTSGIITPAPVIMTPSALVELPKPETPKEEIPPAPPAKIEPGKNAASPEALPVPPLPVASGDPAPVKEAPMLLSPVNPDIPVPPAPPPLPTGNGLPEIAAVPRLPTEPAVTEPDKTPAPAVSGDAKSDASYYPALQSLKKFLSASGWKERQRWSQKSDSIGPLMEKYYRTHPDGPVLVDRAEFVERYAKTKDHPPYCMFEINGSSLKQALLVLVEEPASGPPRVDWEMFVEFKDRLLWLFLIKPVVAPQKFRVMIRRKHAFDKSIPDVEEKDSFELTLPGAETSSLVYVPRDGTAAKMLAQRLPWGSALPVIVELTWRNQGVRRWVEIKSLPAFGWRG